MNIKNKKGITLIALIVTIIVLIIIAGVSIATLTGDNGVLRETNTAKVAQIEATAREQVKLGCATLRLAIAEASAKDNSYDATDHIDLIQGKLYDILFKDTTELIPEGWAKDGIYQDTAKFKIVYEGQDYKNAKNDQLAKIIYTIGLTQKSIELLEEKNDNTFTVSLATNIEGAGTVEFTGEHSGTSVKLKAETALTFTVTVNEGYEFVGWSVEGTPVGTELNGTYTATSDCTITAKFSAPALATPTISLSGDTLTITGVTNATSYDIYSDSKFVSNATEATVDLTTLAFEKFGLANNLTVKAVASGYSDSEASNSVAYTTYLITHSWEEIIAYVNDDTYAEHYGIKAYKPLDLGSEGIVNMEIAALDADVLSDGTGNAHVTWIAKELLVTEHNMNDAHTNENGWVASKMRTYLQKDVWALIPVRVQNAIVAVDKTYYDYTTTSTLVCSDKVWIPSYREVFAEYEDNSGTIYKGRESYGTIYSGLFIDDNSRIKTLNGSTYNWWLRSAYSSYYNRFDFIKDTGENSSHGAGITKGVLLSFCF